MDNIDKINNTNIPNSILVKGVSHDDFVKLFNELKSVIIDEGITDLNNYDAVVEAVRKNDNSSDKEEWISKFENQINDSTAIIKDEFKMIEELFERIFKDWEEYQKTHVSVLETEKKPKKKSKKEKGDTDE